MKKKVENNLTRGALQGVQASYEKQASRQAVYMWTLMYNSGRSLSELPLLFAPFLKHKSPCTIQKAINFATHRTQQRWGGQLISHIRFFSKTRFWLAILFYVRLQMLEYVQRMPTSKNCLQFYHFPRDSYEMLKGVTAEMQLTANTGFLGTKDRSCWILFCLRNI